MLAGLGAAVAAGAALLLVTTVWDLGLLGVCPALFVLMGSFGIVLPNTAARALSLVAPGRPAPPRRSWAPATSSAAPSSPPQLPRRPPLRGPARHGRPHLRPPLRRLLPPPLPPHHRGPRPRPRPGHLTRGPNGASALPGGVPNVPPGAPRGWSAAPPAGCAGGGVRGGRQARVKSSP
ncbi:hypothetical protein ACFQ0M_35835 [Kitasatospora aburaviensis]